MAADPGHKTPSRDRYSRIIRGLRIALPIAAVCLFASIFLFSKTTSFRPGILLTNPQIRDLAQGEKITNPHFSGLTSGGDAFLVTADSALPDAPDPRFVDLERPNSTISFEDGRQIHSVSNSGVLDLQENGATMVDQVVVTTSDGWVLYSDRLELNYDSGNAHSPEAVFGTGPFGTVESEEMTLVQDLHRHAGGGKGVLQFKNNVKVVYTPEQEPPKNEASR